MVSETLLVVLSNILQSPKTWKDIISVILQVSRICVLGMLISFYMELCRRDKGLSNEDPEHQPLLRKNSRSKATDTTESRSGSAAKSDSAQTSSASNNEVDNDLEYAKDVAADASADEDVDNLTKKEREDKKRVAIRLAADGDWFTHIKSFAIFWPWFFPVNNRRLQACFFGTGLCILFGNVMNVIVAMQFGNMCTAIVGTESSTQGPWSAVALYVLLWVLNSPAAIGNLRFYLWLPVEQYGYQASNIAACSYISYATCFLSSQGLRTKDIVLDHFHYQSMRRILC